MLHQDNGRRSAAVISRVSDLTISQESSRVVTIADIGAQIIDDMIPSTLQPTSVTSKAGPTSVGSFRVQGGFLPASLLAGTQLRTIGSTSVMRWHCQHACLVMYRGLFH